MDKESNFCKDAEDLLEYLKTYHNTEKTAIKSGEIGEIFNLYKEKLRSTVNYLRSIGYPVCSSSRGYWYSEKPEDIEKTLTHLEGRIKGMNRAISGLKRIQQDKKKTRIKQERQDNLFFCLFYILGGCRGV